MQPGAARGENGNTPLHLAADAKTVLELVRAGADLFARNDAGQTPAEFQKAQYDRHNKRGLPVKISADEPYETLRAVTAFKEAEKSGVVDAKTWGKYWSSTKKQGEIFDIRQKRMDVQAAVFPLFLEAVEKTGGRLDCFSDYNRFELSHTVREEKNISLWLEHCDRQGYPPGGEDLYAIQAQQNLDSLFAAPYWQTQHPASTVGRLQPFIERLSKHFTGVMQEQFPDMPGALVADWLAGEEGAKLSAKEVKELVRALPEPVREQVHNLHQQVALRTRNEFQQAFESGLQR